MSTVPIIVVFTKFDLFVEDLNGQRGGKDKISREFAERRFKEEHSHALEKWTKSISSQIPYNFVASMFVSLDALLVLTSLCSFTAGYFASAG